ncbi:Imm26 family immunity protein [Bacillus nakamurai]|uniref:Imm26 family immunity protein n=1 Tax=Bacillus nakamurai TaxID=1793963 RepID=UPI001E4F031F|nr:Imm26 family immunity protein [Bacillus nakamurai]MCC9021911.1 hypothetical protein [Bacillus nakamurai]
MGYWEEEYKNKKVLLSDEGLDICFDAIEKSELYKRDLDREPILEEFLATLVTEMNTNGDSSFTELVNKRIVEIKATTRKAKSIAKVIPGAVIQIPLDKIGKYTYAWVIEGDLSKDKDDDILIQYYNIFTDNTLSREEVISLMKEEKKKIFVANTGYTGLLQGDWKVISKMPQEVIEKDNNSPLKFVIYEDGKYLMSEGDSFASEDQLVETDEKTGKDIPNPLGIFGHSSVESILYKYFEGMTMEEIIKNEL